MSSTVPTTDEQQVRDLIDARTDAQYRKDADAVTALYAPGPVLYDLAPPLTITGTRDDGIARLAAWFAGFDGPVEFTVRDLVVTVSDDLALAHGLSSMTATPNGAPAAFTLWFRSTLGLRKTDGSWRIVHEHKSTPFHMDMDPAGNFRAATDLTP